MVPATDDGVCLLGAIEWRYSVILAIGLVVGYVVSQAWLWVAKRIKEQEQDDGED